VVVMMARTKGAIRLISKAAAAKEFDVKWYQVDHLVRKFRLQPIPVFSGDHRTKHMYRYDDVARLMRIAPLKRAS